ncbi:restriction endonuclease [Streptomyces collinus]|jgi:restriction system protein|uniref:restriction endonuclease n=1 Tax=Streptomyces collinus TaxID=42684 RepID=UPI0033CDAE42
MARSQNLSPDDRRTCAAGCFGILLVLSAISSIVGWQQGQAARGATQFFLTLLVAGVWLFALTRHLWPGRRSAHDNLPFIWEDPFDTSDRVTYGEMSARAFEEAIADLCARDGCQDAHASGRAGDLGADVIATTPDGSRLIIQCKRYGPGHKVGSQDLQRFGGTCFSIHRADIAAIVTTSMFTGPAVEYAARQGILLFNQHDLAAWSEGVGPAPWQKMGDGAFN